MMTAIWDITFSSISNVTIVTPTKCERDVKKVSPAKLR